MDSHLWAVLGGGTLAAITFAPRFAIARSRRESNSLNFDVGRPTPDDVRSIVSSGYGRPRGSRLHRALDMPVPVGTPISAIGDGVVVRARTTDESDAGKWVAVLHPSGVTSRYLHLSRVLVKTAQRVKQGETIGHSGNTGNSEGPHLHLDLRAPADRLELIARVAGKPRSGWGPELKPYGYSIPGEPWIPLDGYREHVIREAEAEGIPLLGASVRNGGLSYRSVGERGEPYPDWVRALRGKSGVYVIRDLDSSETLYVGESHTNNLYATLTRHFQEWRRYKGFWRGHYAEGHDPGLTYPRGSVEVAVRVLPSSEAIDEEARLIRRLRPRDNLLGQPVEEPIPF